MSACIRRGFLGLALAIWGAASAWAERLPPPEGDVILTVRGNIAVKNLVDGTALDLDMIEAMGVETMHTGTIWTDGVREFQGIELSRLLEQLGAEGETLRLIALNDYAVEIPMTEAVDGGPMLAYRMDGIILSTRDKGPLWMIYPFDPKPEYKNEVSYSRSVWQLMVIEVLP
ncbi:MAG: molybdopterin-dependent oxidoreductase [Paracoccaceae bacterium]